MSALDKAMADCVRWHEGQRRKLTGAPYATHPIEVCKRLAEAGVTDEQVLITALLHDVVEDSDATLDDIRGAYGRDVARWVGELSKPEDADKATWLAEFVDASAPALLVKLADRYCNVHDWISGGDAARASDYAGLGHAVYLAVDGRHGEFEDRFGPTVLANAWAWVAELRRIAGGTLPPERGRGL